MNEIFKKLQQWREDRNIRESTENDYKANMFEELSKYYRAKDDNERIDALCDMAIFTINHAELNNVDIDIDFDLEIEPINEDLDFETIEKQTLYSMFVDFHLEGAIFDVAFFLFRHGYDFEKCMLETIKEISSRRQDPKQFCDWVENGASGKWLKNQNQDPETLYKADYEMCKL